MTALLGSFTVRSLRRSAYLRGFASAIDLRGDSRHQYRFAASPERADFDALRNDWENVGQDLAAALDAEARQRLAQ